MIKTSTRDDVKIQEYGTIKEPTAWEPWNKKRHWEGRYPSQEGSRTSLPNKKGARKWLPCSILVITTCQPWSVGRLALGFRWPWTLVPKSAANTPWSLGIPLADFVSLPPCSCGHTCYFPTLAQTGGSASTFIKHCGSFLAQRWGYAGQKRYHPQPLTSSRALLPPTPPHAKHPALSYSEPLTSSKDPSDSQCLSRVLQVFSLQGKSSHPKKIRWITICPFPYLGTVWEWRGCRGQRGGRRGPAIRPPESPDHFLYLGLSFTVSWDCPLPEDRFCFLIWVGPFSAYVFGYYHPKREVQKVPPTDHLLSPISKHLTLWPTSPFRAPSFRWQWR